MTFMNISTYNPTNVFPPRGNYSQLAVAPFPGGKMLFLAGQVGWDMDYQVVGTSVREQMTQTMVNIENILKTQGADWSSVVRMTTYLVDMKSGRDQYVEVSKQFLKGHLPASTLLEVKGLASPDIIVEIEITAILYD